MRLRQALRDPGRTWYITRDGTDFYHLIRDLGGGEFLDWDFRVPTGLAGGYQTPQLVTARVGVPMLPADEDQAVYSGTWTTSYVDAATGYGSHATTGSINASSGVLTLASAKLTSASVGRRMTIVGAGAAGANLDTNIISVQSATQATVAPAAQTTVSGTPVTLWPSHRYSTQAGATATWTSPDGATDLGLIVVFITNGGLGKVSIDGDASAATLLPTAQQLVDLGTYPATILTTGGGTLAPTDRVVSCYNVGAVYADARAIASGLAPGVHTVTVTVTGYTPTGAGSANRTYVTGFCSGAAGQVTPTTPNALTLATSPVLSMQSAVEAVYWWNPPGATLMDFVGRLHGYEAPVSLTLTVDGAPTSVPVGGSVTVPASSRAVFTQQTSLRHPQVNAGATGIADVTFVYTLDGEGMTVESAYTSLISANLQSGYAAMLPADARFDRYTSSALRAALSATAGDGSQKGAAPAYIAALWTSGGRYALSMELLRPGDTVNGWARSAPGHMFCQDRAPSGALRINKVYASRIGSPSTQEPVTPGTVLRGGAVYRFKRFADLGAAEQALTAI